MKSIGIIIKMHTRELDEMRVNVVKCEEERSQLISYYNKMEDDLELEHILASNNYELGETFTNYRHTIRDRQKIIAKSCKDLDKRIATLKENIAAKFTEIKKYEILLANQQNEERKRQDAAETRRLDEVAINNHLKENDS